MARYEHLPIYKAAMDLGVYLEGMVHNFSRYHNYTTGQDLRNLGISRLESRSHRRNGTAAAEKRLSQNR